MEAIDPLSVLRSLDVPAWLVGGAVRDRLLARPTADYDVALAGEARTVARELARRVSGHPFELSEGFGAWRVVSRDRLWNVDLLPLSGDSIRDDLSHRDLTINAMAESLAGGGLIDPFGGERDLAERRLRMVTPDAFAADPLRSLRLVRLSCELDFEPESETAVRAASAAPGLESVSPERVFAELRRIISSDRAVSGLRLMEELGLTPVLLPELSALRGVEQSAFHHLDVYEHTLAVLAQAIQVERDPGAFLGPGAAAVSEFLSAPLANELTRWQALRLGALFHDIAKPLTRGVTDQGRVTFMGHDSAGSDLARSILVRLRSSDRLANHVAALTQHHLRLGFLVHEAPLSRRSVYRYLRATAPVSVDVTVLSIADRLATRGRGSDEAIDAHLQLAWQLLGDALSWEAEPPRPPIRGHELASALDLRPGPELGALLAELEAASFAGEVSSPEQAVSYARELLRSRSIGSRANE
ncbi:MAG: HDIG domain-containing protein [Solirubrobacterales bacterium]|nr:HDIG domain-containing protein [Solirubrobacterales bacterium]